MRRSCPWLGRDWKSYVHPEGALYLYNGRQVSIHAQCHIFVVDHCTCYLQRTFTEANMDESTFNLVDGCINALYQVARENSVDLEDSKIELVVQVEQAEDDDAPVSCQYYFIDHATRSLFWLHENDRATENIFSGLRGIYDPSHIGASCRIYDATGMN